MRVNIIYWESCVVYPRFGNICKIEKNNGFCITQATILARGIASSVTVASVILDTTITSPHSSLASPDGQDRQQQ